MAIFAPDLTQRAPRSPRIKLGGINVLPRILDKCRATIAKKNGEFMFNCPLDQRFFEFAGVNAEKFKKEVAKGKSDSEMLAWVQKNAKHSLCPGTVAQWTAINEARAPSSIETRGYMSEAQAKLAPKREDIATWFDLLDVDDYVTFGGQP